MKKDDEKDRAKIQRTGNVTRILPKQPGLTNWQDALRGKVALPDGRFIYPEEMNADDVKARLRMMHGDPTPHVRALMELLEDGVEPRSGKFPALMEKLVALWAGRKKAARHPIARVVLEETAVEHGAVRVVLEEGEKKP